jgi:hypothetical protein
LTREGETIMDDEIEAFLRGWFGEETSDDREGLRRDILNASSAYQRRLKEDLEQLIEDRSLTTKEFFEATWLQVEDQDEVQRLLTDAYTGVFGAGD